MKKLIATAVLACVAIAPAAMLCCMSASAATPTPTPTFTPPAGPVCWLVGPTFLVNVMHVVKVTADQDMHMLYINLSNRTTLTMSYPNDKSAEQALADFHKWMISQCGSYK